MGVPVEIARQPRDAMLQCAPVFTRGAGKPDGADRLGAVADRDPGFEEMAARHSAFMFRVAHGLLRNAHDAEDAVQEVLLKLCRTGAWLEIIDERAFLARAVWRAGLDIALRRARHVGSEQRLEPRDTSLSAESAMIANSERELLRRLIDGLPEELRQPLILSAIQEMTSRDAGAVLGMPEATVRTRVARARAELRRRYLALPSREQQTGGKR